MDLLMTSVPRALGVLGLAVLLASAACVSEKGEAGGAAGTSESGSDDEMRGTAGGTGGARPGTGGYGGIPNQPADGGLVTEDDAGSTLDGAVDGGDGGDGCAQGFVAGADGCLRDQCLAWDDEPAACGEHGSCTDGTDGKPTCKCDEGYELEHLQCVRNPCIAIDDDPGACDRHASCTYEGDSETSCECDEGYDGDGESCERNACVQLDGEDPPCHANQVCTPTGPGERSCECEEDFGDCDDEASNGCEAYLMDDALNCGTCDFACGADLTCDSKECERRITSINLGFYVSTFIDRMGNVLGSGDHDALLRMDDPATSPIDLGLPDARSVSINLTHACLLRADGTGVNCWGSNSLLQLGGSDTADNHVRLVVENATAVAVGYAHSCLVVSGLVYCWGSGATGGFGDGSSSGTRTFEDAFEPSEAVPHVTGAVDVRAGQTQTCALRTDGHVFCWGSDAGDEYDAEEIRDAELTALEADAICTGVGSPGTELEFAL